MDVQVRFPKQGRSVSVPSGTLLLDAVRSADLPIASACRRATDCAGAAASRSSPARDDVAAETPEESRSKQRNRIDPRLRLACRIRVCADLSVAAPYW